MAKQKKNIYKQDEIIFRDANSCPFFVSETAEGMKQARLVGRHGFGYTRPYYAPVYWHNEPPTLKRCPQGLLSFFGISRRKAHRRHSHKRKSNGADKRSIAPAWIGL